MSLQNIADSTATRTCQRELLAPPLWMGRGNLLRAKSRRTHWLSPLMTLDSPSRKLGANFGSKTPNKPVTFCHHSRARLRSTPPVCSPFLSISLSMAAMHRTIIRAFQDKEVEPRRRTTPEVVADCSSRPAITYSLFRSESIRMDLLTDSGRRDVHEAVGRNDARR